MIRLRRRVTGYLLALSALMMAACSDRCDDPGSADCAPVDPDARVAGTSQQPQGLRLGAVLGETSLAGFARAAEPRRFEFPGDYGAHRAFRSEWWYLTLNLQDADGADFGVQFTLFRQALTPTPVTDNPWQTNQVYLAHLALTDVAGGSHREFQRYARGHPALAGVLAEPFALWLEDWRLAESPDGGWLLSAAAGEISLELSLAQQKPPVLQGDRGLSRKGPDQASYYFSLPRLRVSGIISEDGEAHRVTGQGWFDREWSTSVLGSEQTGWDWFALQFFDSSEFTGFQLRRRDGRRDPYDAALRVDVAGAGRSLEPGQFNFVPERYWRDDRGVRWPVEWQLQVEDQRWRVVAALDDQRMDTALVYWEGLVYVYDPKEQLIGRGYMELTGYADE